jgi:hypothetical protein
VPSDSRRFLSIRGVACLILALAAAPMGGARAQDPDADPSDLGLKTDAPKAAPPNQVLPDATDDPAVRKNPNDSAEDDGTKKKDGKKDKNAAKKAKALVDAARLPPLKPYFGADRIGLRGGLPDPDPAKSGRSGEAPPPGPTIAALPPPPPRRKIPLDDKPYDPLGFRVGGLQIRPYIEEDIGWNSNPAYAPGKPKASGFEMTEAGASLQSDWSRSELRGDIKAGYVDYFATPQLSAPYGSGTIDGRYDISRDLALDGEGRFAVVQEPQSALGLSGGQAGASNQTLSTYGLTLGGAQKFGDLTLALHGTYDRTQYQDDAGTAQNLASDDYNDFGAKARATYRWTEAFAPYLEFGADTRRYDSYEDASGYHRDSNGTSAVAGATLNFSKMLTGDASLGYGERQYQDPRLPDAGAPLFNASLVWSATELTTLTFKAQTALGDAVLAGASADITHGYSVELSHALTRAIILGASAGYATDHYAGVALDDSTTTLGLKGEYHLGRHVVLKASATRQQFVTSAANGNYIADVFMFGLRIQE